MCLEAQRLTVAAARLGYDPARGYGPPYRAGKKLFWSVLLEIPEDAPVAPGAAASVPTVNPDRPDGRPFPVPAVVLDCPQHRSPVVGDPGSLPADVRSLWTHKPGSCRCPVRHPDSSRRTVLWPARYNRARDTQQRKVYDWEGDAVGEPHDHGLDASEVQEFVDEVSAGWGVPSIETRVDPRRTSSSATSWNQMSLWLRPSRWVVVHEAAHHVVARLVGALSAVPDHGSEFMGVYLQSLERYCGLDREGLAASARRAGVEVADLDPSCPDHSHQFRTVYEPPRVGRPWQTAAVSW